MSYYRDRSNPDAVHFPARLDTVALVGLLALAVVLGAALVWFSGAGIGRLWQLAPLLVCVWLIVFAWPKHILTDQAGIHAGRVFQFRRRFIAWRDFSSVRMTNEVPLVPRLTGFWMGNWAIEVRGAEGTAPIRFTCRHSGREAFIAQIKRWRGVDIEL